MAEPRELYRWTDAEHGTERRIVEGPDGRVIRPQYSHGDDVWFTGSVTAEALSMAAELARLAAVAALSGHLDGRSPEEREGAVVDVASVISACVAGRVRDLEAERDALAHRVRDLERSESQLVDERDAHFEEVDAIADQLGVEEEWTSGSSRAVAAIEAAAALEAERDRLRALVARMRREIKLDREVFPENFTPQGLADLDAVLADPDGQAAEAWLREREEKATEPWRTLVVSQREALEVALKWSGVDTDAWFERWANEFQRETGVMAPGKDSALPMTLPGEDERVRRSQLWERWLGEQARRVERTLAQALNDRDGQDALAWLASRLAQAREEGKAEGLYHAAAFVRSLRLRSLGEELEKIAGGTPDAKWCLCGQLLKDHGAGGCVAAERDSCARLVEAEGCICDAYPSWTPGEPHVSACPEALAAAIRERGRR